MNSLTHLLGEFDFREPAVRAAVTRLSAQGWLETRRIGRNSYCSLTTKGWQRVDEAASRVYRNRRENWDGKWCILTYTIPEEKREARDQLRTDLVWWGFGQLATSTWISPHKYSRHMVDLVNRYNLSDYVDIFYACYEGAKTNLQLAQKSWNLNEVQQKYNEFVAVFLPAFQADKLNPPSDREAFVKRCRLVHEYRKFLFIDPALPNELLPQDWGGTRAFNLIQQYDRLLAPGAGRYFVKLFAAAPDSTPQDIEQGLEAQLNPFGLGD